MLIGANLTLKKITCGNEKELFLSLKTALHRVLVQIRLPVPRICYLRFEHDQAPVCPINPQPHEKLTYTQQSQQITFHLRCSLATLAAQIRLNG